MEQMMSENATNSTAKAPVWFWIVSVVALLWNLAGLMAFVGQLATKPEDMTQDAAFQELLKGLPVWYFVVFGVAVVFGTVGSAAMLMRAKWALPALIISLMGVVSQQCYSYFMSNTLEVVGFAGMIFPSIVLLIAIALVVFSKRSVGKGWLR